MEKKKCVFTTDIADTLSCSQTGDFDDYGFPVPVCELFPCEKYKEIISKINKEKKNMEFNFIHRDHLQEK